MEVTGSPIRFFIFKMAAGARTAKRVLNTIIDAQYLADNILFINSEYKVFDSFIVEQYCKRFLSVTFEDLTY